MRPKQTDGASSARGTEVLRREFLIGATSLVLSGCGGGGSGTLSPLPVVIASLPPTPVPTPAPTTAAVVGPETVTVQQFYKAADGNNLQPAFQAALDAAAAKSLRRVVNDMNGAAGEMWCPARTTSDDGQNDGIPLVVRQPVAIDFRNIQLMLKGPTGGNRMIGQPIANSSQPWLGGWLNVIGHSTFDLISVENVVVDGGFAGDTVSNRDSNVSDKGFRVQDTQVERVIMRNVELRNFAGEIYYIGGLGPQIQEVVDCHFHGSPQCSWNPGGTGKVVATNLQAGRGYQVAEVLGGKGHTYDGGRFYDSGAGGATFLGGPSPGFRENYPYSFAYWDGSGDRPWVTFNGTVFDTTPAVQLACWMRGKIVTIDTPVWLLHNVGHLRDLDLQIESRVNRSSNFEALGLFGPPDLNTQVHGAPIGTYIQAPSDMALKVHCVQTENAMTAGRYHAAAVRYFGGVLDGNSIALSLSGVATRSWEEVAMRSPGFVTPKISTTGFRLANG